MAVVSDAWGSSQNRRVTTPSRRMRRRHAGPFSFEGLGQGTYFRRVYQATLDTFLGYSCALYVVEPDPAFLAMALHLHEWGELLADDRIHCFIGPQWEQAFRQTFDDYLDLAFLVQALQPAGRALPGVVDGD